MRTSLPATESSWIAMSRGEISLTCTSAPLGMSMSLALRLRIQTDAVSVSGTRSVIGRRDRSRSISLPRPLSSTETVGGAASRARPGGGSTTIFRLNVCVTGCCAATATYSISASARAASLIAQLRVMKRVRLPLIDQPPHQVFVHRTVPLGRPDHLLHDDAVTIDHEALRNAGRLVALADVAGLVVQHLERQPQLAHERVDHGGIVLIHAHGNDPKVGAGEFLRQPLQRRHLHAAGRAPRGPDVDEDGPPAVVLERGGTPGAEIDRGERRGFRPHAEQGHLRPQLDDQGDGKDGRRHHPRHQCPLPRSLHTATRQRRRSSATSRPGSALPNTALPATNVSAPATCASAIVSVVIPPSISRNAREPCAVQPVGAAGQHQAHLLGEPGQVGGENAGRDADAVRHCGLRATTMSTAVPGGASVPAAGRCATTVPGLASDVRRRVTLPSCKPSTSRRVRASAWLMFSRSGTVIVASPRLITSATPAPGASGSPAGGRVSPTTPGGTRGTWIDSTCATLSPAAIIRRRATDPSSPVTSGTGILGGPALDTRVTRPSATALTPGGGSCQMIVPWGAVGWGSVPPSTT